MARPKTRTILRLLPVAVVLLAAATHVLWLRALGSFLVKTDAPEQSEVAMVLGGDYYGARLIKAAELVREGYAPRILISGPPCLFGTHESDLALPFAEKKGYPAEWFVPVPHEGLSTREEAQALIAELKRRNVRRSLIVTSDYHTRRAGAIFRSVGPGIDFYVISAPDRFFSAGAWWRNREGRKKFAMEWMKTVAEWVGL